MITNKDNYKGDKEVYPIILALEVAQDKQDLFSASLLLTRLKTLGLKIIVDNSAKIQ
jgi:hypothetical protein